MYQIRISDSSNSKKPDFPALIHIYLCIIITICYAFWSVPHGIPHSAGIFIRNGTTLKIRIFRFVRNKLKSRSHGIYSVPLRSAEIRTLKLSHRFSNALTPFSTVFFI